MSCANFKTSNMGYKLQMHCGHNIEKLLMSFESSPKNYLSMCQKYILKEERWSQVKVN